MDGILKAESWQIFGVIIIPYIVYAILPEKMLELVSPYFLTVFYWITFGWPLIVGHKLNRKLPHELRKSEVLFLISGFYTIVLSSLIALYDFSYETQDILFGLKKVLIIISLLSFFYILYFSSMTLRKFEKKRNVTFEEYRIICFLFFVNIIGVWILQSRIKNVIENPEYKESGVK